MAIMLLELGDVGKARVLAEEQLERSRRVLGDNHPATLAGLNNLAIILGAAGDVAGSVDLHRRVVQGRRRLLGPQHPDTLNSTYGLALALVKLRGPGDTEAQSLASEAAVGLAELYGDNHPSTLRARELAVGHDAAPGHAKPEAAPT
jgi:Tetratricopeptide repeat